MYIQGVKQTFDVIRCKLGDLVNDVVKRNVVMVQIYDGFYDI